jgi:hypothetical protein
MDPAEKKFTTATLVAAAGCEIGTFHKWRLRNGLFPETRNTEGWNRFSIIDICVVRIIVVLTAHRLSADTAVHVAQYARGHLIQDLFKSKTGHGRYFGLCPPDPSSHRDAAFVSLGPEDTLLEAFRTAGAAALPEDHFEPALSGVLTIIDLWWVIAHVVQRIKLLEPDTLPDSFESILPPALPSIAMTKPTRIGMTKRKSGKQNVSRSR